MMYSLGDHFGKRTLGHCYTFWTMSLIIAFIFLNRYAHYDSIMTGLKLWWPVSRYNKSIKPFVNFHTLFPNHERLKVKENTEIDVFCRFSIFSWNLAKCIIFPFLFIPMLFAPKVISIICSLEPQDLVIEWLDEDGGKKRYCFQEKQE